LALNLYLGFWQMLCNPGLDTLMVARLSRLLGLFPAQLLALDPLNAVLEPALALL
jgi:hypothetical protein